MGAVIWFVTWSDPARTPGLVSPATGQVPMPVQVGLPSTPGLCFAGTSDLSQCDTVPQSQYAYSETWIRGGAPPDRAWLFTPDDTARRLKVLSHNQVPPSAVSQKVTCRGTRGHLTGRVGRNAGQQTGTT